MQKQEILTINFKGGGLLYMHSIKPEVVGKSLKKKEGLCEVEPRWALFGFIESLKPGPVFIQNFFSFFFLMTPSCIARKIVLKNVLANEIVGFGGLNLFIYFSTMWSNN